MADASAEASRFRHGRSEFRTCPLCGFANAPDAKGCARVLLEVVEVTSAGGGDDSAHAFDGRGQCVDGRRRAPIPAPLPGARSCLLLRM